MIKIGSTIYSKGNDTDFSDAFTDSSSIGTGRIEFKDGKTWLDVATVISPKFPETTWDTAISGTTATITDLSAYYLSKDYAGVNSANVPLSTFFTSSNKGDYQINASALVLDENA